MSEFAIRVNWYRSVRGQGQTDCGCSLHADIATAEAVIAEHWQAHARAFGDARAPDEYMAAERAIYRELVTPELLAKIKTAGGSLRFYPWKEDGEPMPGA